VSSQVLERWQATFRDDKLDNKTVRHAMQCDATGRPARCRQASVMRSAQCANASNGNRPRPTPTRKQTNEHADSRNKQTNEQTNNQIGHAIIEICCVEQRGSRRRTC
jgi:hypothetical protein